MTDQSIRLKFIVVNAFNLFNYGNIFKVPSVIVKFMDKSFKVQAVEDWFLSGTIESNFADNINSCKESDVLTGKHTKFLKLFLWCHINKAFYLEL